MTKPAYYNENDPYAVQWLRNLISAGHIPPGEVDDRSIVDVKAADLRGFGQCHFFAGIGGLGLACRIAGWPDDRPIWTGGFPCQPFSQAGRQLAQKDDRHLWPVLFGLIEQERPPVFIGENVAGIIDLALDGVLFDLEGAGYASRAFVVPACAKNAPHRRDRVWIAAKRMADPASQRRISSPLAGLHGREAGAGTRDGEPERCGGGGGALADANGTGSSAGGESSEDAGYGRAVVSKGWSSPWLGAEYINGADGKARRVGTRVRELADGVSDSLVGMRAGTVETIPLLAKGVPDRVNKLRAFGNAIVPAVAAEIIKAVMKS